VKVIEQLISYLEARGRLTAEQVERFVSQGYWRQYTPSDLRSLERKVGQSFFFQVRAEARGPLWGTDIYTSDSSLGMACIHAGVLKSGQSGVVKVTIVQPPPTFNGSMRHGVTSAEWHTGWAGAFRVEPVKKSFGPT
jgi:hypothetical protein